MKKYLFTTLLIIISFFAKSNCAMKGGSVVVISTQKDTVCLGDTLLLEGSATCFIYSINWSIDLGQNGIGQYAILYPTNSLWNKKIYFSKAGQFSVGLFVDSDCGTGYFVKTITVLPKPTVTLTIPFDTICNNSSQINLSGGNPSNGFYLGVGITNNILYPNLTNSPYNVISYEYTDLFGCKNIAVDSIYINVCSVIEENKIDNDIKIFPNPFHIQTSVKFNNSENSEYSFVLYNTLGKKVEEVKNIISNEFEIKRNDLPNGIYLYRLISSSKIIHGKIIIE